MSTRPVPADPVTPEEWAEAVDAAVLFVTLDCARQYGLVVGGPEVHVERCKEILRRAQALGIVVPTVADVIDRHQ